MLHYNTIKGLIAALILPVVLFISGFGMNSFAQELAAHEPNIIYVKFTQESLTAVDKQMATTQALTSISTVDALNMQFSAVEMRQAIRTDPRYAQRHAQYGLDRWFEISFDGNAPVAMMMDAYASDPNIEIAEPRYHYEIMGQPTSEPITREELAGLLSFDDPRLDEQWHYNNTGQTGGTPGADINLFAAWDIETGDEEIVVQVVDTGIDLTHPDLVNQLWVNPVPGPENGYDGDIHGWSHVTGSSDVQDTHGHGSHCSGTIAGTNGNGIGVAGVAGGDGTEGSGVRIMASRVFVGATGGGGFAEAVVYGADNGAVIANHSWGGGGFSQMLRDAILYFMEVVGYDDEGNPVGPVQGGLIVFAAGNNGSGNANQPIASNPEVMAVASSNHNDQKAWYSQYGSWVTLTAPGGETNNVTSQGVLSSVTNGNYQFYQGTSMAAPHAVGLAALIASSFKGEITGPEIQERMVATVDDISDLNPNFDMGVGRINAFRALEQDDGVAPSDITDMEVTGSAQSSVSLAWTAPGSSGETGAAFRYDLRYSKNPITASNFYGAVKVEDAPRPMVAGSEQFATISGLDHSTTYYFAVKATDFFGNLSGISNTVSATTSGNPEMAIDPDVLYAVAEENGDNITETFTISNSGNADLNFSFPGVAVTELLRTPGIQLNETSNIYGDIDLEKGETDQRIGHPVLMGAGGPDEYGYTWIDSNEGGGPVFNWIEISEVGTPISALSGTWDGNTSVDLPFDFPFYGDEHNSARVSVNGWIHFGSFTGSAFTNREIPSTQDPRNYLAVLWDDLDMRNSGTVYRWHDEDNNRFIIQWNNVPKTGNSGSSFTFQAILNSTGAIEYQYKTMNGNTAANTIGIENQDGTDGLQVAFNTSYVENDLKVRIASAPDWLSLSETSGTIAPGESMDIEATFYPEGLAAGVYVEELSVGNNQIGGGSAVLPVSFQIGDGEGTLAIETEEMEFGDVYVNGTNTMPLKLTNSGTSEIDIVSVGLESDDFSISDTEMKIAPGLSRNLMVTFSPQSAGAKSTTLTINTNEATNNVHSIELSGSGMLAPSATFGLASTTVTLSVDEEAVVPFTMSNSGQGELEFSITLGNANLLGNLNRMVNPDRFAGEEELSEIGLQVFGGNSNDEIAVVSRFDLASPADAKANREAASALKAFSFFAGSGSAGFGINADGELVRSNVYSGTERVISTLTGISGTATDLATNPADGKTYLLVSQDNTAAIYGLNTAGDLTPAHTISAPVTRIAFNGNGHLFTADANGFVGVMKPSESTRGVYVHTTLGHSGMSEALSSLAWDAQTGQLFAGYTAGDSFAIGMINPVSGKITPVSGLVDDAHDWIAFPMDNGFDWITFDPSEGTVNAGGSSGGTFSVNPNGQFPSEYDIVVMVHTNDPLKEMIATDVRINLQGEPESFVQIIHNSADPALAEVDIYVNGELAVEGVTYQSATAYFWLSSTAEVALAPAGSEGVSEAVYDVTLDLERGDNYTIIANGFLGTGNPDLAFDLWVLEDTMTSSGDDEALSFVLFHGVTDAPAVDVALREGGIFAEGLEYGMASEYHFFANDVQIFDVFPAGLTDYFANFEQDFSMYGGKSVTLLFSGFAEASAGEPEFSLVAVFPDGEVLLPRNATSVVGGDENELPDSFALGQNYPNPFNPTTNIEYALPEAASVRIEVYNIQGQRVATLVNGQQNAGTHTVSFDASRLSSGMYLYRIQAGSYTEVRKMMLVK